MKINTTLKYLFYKITKLTLYKKLPFGIDPYEDIKFQFKNYNFSIFFDIGANIGQSINKIRNIFPHSEIWSFEPVHRTFEILKENTSSKNVNCFQLGFGSQDMETEISVNQDNSVSDMNSIFKTNSDCSGLVEKIKIKKLDTFCKIHAINKIDYVKIDTEGYDLEVLKGSCELLKDQRISFVEVEVSMNPGNTFHVKLEDAKEFIERFDYRVYGIYEQTQEWPTKTPILRRANILFIAKNIYNNK